MSENRNDILDKFENKLELHFRHRQAIEPSHVNIDTALGTCIGKDDAVILHFVCLYIVYSISSLASSCRLWVWLQRTGC